MKNLQRSLTKILTECRVEIETKNPKRNSLSHGFRKGHSIVTNSRPHTGRRYVLNVDIKDFFPSLNFGRVRGYFLKNKDFQLSEKTSTVIAQIACYKNSLPQGSPCSPIISDLLAHILDVRLVNLAKKYGCTYSRYADDLTFSTNQKVFPVALAAPMKENAMKWEIGADLRQKITNSDFTVNDEKTRMQYSVSRQTVTGLVVNKKVNIKSGYYRIARSMCRAAFKTGKYKSKGAAEISDLARLQGQLRVRPISSSRITEFSEHEANGCEAQEDQAAEVEIFPILGQSAATVEPSDCTFDDPSARQNDEAFGAIGTLDDFGFELRSNLGQRRMKDRPRIGAVGKEPFQERKKAEKRGQQHDAAVAILNIGRMNNRVQQQTLCIYQDMPLLALDELARVEPGRIDAGAAFFGAFHTLAVDDGGGGTGFASRLLATLLVKRVVDAIQRAVDPHRQKYRYTVLRGGKSLGM